ncbi:MAG: PIN domain-containing protein [Candidatus Dadabacteria bacterium]|nr:MAG: PIN domain-containing protein [Candidatus Dadabacteria bacterium]
MKRPRLCARAVTSRLVVVDTSAIAALLFNEPQASEVAARLTQRVLSAPTLLAYELANVALVKMRRHPDRADVFRRSYDLVGALRIRFVEADAAAVLDIANETGLTAYDAAYLWLARLTGADLVTLDRRLAAAFGTGVG